MNCCPFGQLSWSQRMVVLGLCSCFRPPGPGSIDAVSHFHRARHWSRRTSAALLHTGFAGPDTRQLPKLAEKRDTKVTVLRCSLTLRI